MENREGKMSLTGILAIILAFAMIMPISAIVARNSSERTEEFKAIVFVGNGEASEVASAFGLEVIEDYDTFMVVRMTDSQRSALQSAGMIVADDYGMSQIKIDGYDFDTTIGEPKIPVNLKIERYPLDVQGHYLIQFIGPVKEEWKKDIERLGGAILGYVPEDAFIVRMGRSQMEKIENLREVQWMGIYQPAYKVRPVLWNMDGKFDVKIITFKGEGINSVLRMLTKGEVIKYFKNEDFGVVKATIDRSYLPKLARLNSVEYVEPIYEMRVQNQNMQWLVQSDQFNNRSLWDRGINGSGQVVAIADTGLDFDHNFFREDASTIAKGGRFGPDSIYNKTDFTRRKLVRYEVMSWWDDVDPLTDPWAWRDSAYRWVSGNITSGHGTMVSGTFGGNDDPIGSSLRDGNAKGAKIYLQDIGTIWKRTVPPNVGAWDDSLRYIPDDYNFLFLDPYEEGIRIHSNSWGARNTDYDLEAMMVDKFVWEHPDMLIVYSNGNEATSGPGSPSTAKSCVSVGWSQPYPNPDNLNAASSVGPTADGRRKPTVVVVGSGYSSRSDGNPWTSVPTTDVYWGGTSYSGPVISSLAAMVRQYFEEGWYPAGTKTPGNAIYPSAALIKALIAASAKQITGSYSDRLSEGVYPNNSQGWGRPVLDDALYFSGEKRKLQVVDHKQGLLTGQSVEYSYLVTDLNTPLRVQLAWSDYPGSVPTNWALVNNLDLTVTSPSGATYKGNVFKQFSEGESRPNFGGYDPRNPLEGVLVKNPTLGEWKVKVTATNVPAGPQPFGLVVLGALDLGYAQMSLDKQVYGDSDTINIRVEDVGASSVTVNVRSDTETDPEVVSLSETAPGSGVFTGSIDTSYGPLQPNGVLEVSDGDIINVSYFDSSPRPRTIWKLAVVDGSPPVITNVRAIDITNAAATITWETDEPSSSNVYYGTDPSNLSNASIQSPLGLFVSHSVDLLGLQTGTKYYFDVESADWFSHTSRDDNGGIHYSFITTEKAEVLLIIGAGDTPFPPDRVQRYRNAFNAHGWSFNEWYKTRSGSPSLQFLQGYKVVMWQTGLEEYPPLSDDERHTITKYIDGGGRFFISSHDVAWALRKDSGSEWGTVERGQWLNSTLKTSWKLDPRRVTAVEGIPGDEISGSYAGTNRLSYTYHREGGSGDEIRSQNYGGTPSYVWKDYGADSTPDNIALKWLSSGNNDSIPGDDPNIVWDGYPSKIVAFYFEVTGINFDNMNDIARGNVINRTIVWLIGHDHPDVQVSYPNGGEIFTGNSVTIYWNRTVYSSGINAQTLFYSPDDGQSWLKITDVAPASTSYSWDISALKNGVNYRVKVVVQDDGNPYPMLNGSDISDSTFTINRAGGDNEGPLTVPGSVASEPDPVNRTFGLWFNATIDDRNKGNSTIAEAEFFIDSIGSNGTGTSMQPADSAFDSPVEEVTWNGNATWTSGSHVLYVHGKDVAGNWGACYGAVFNVRGKIISPPTSPMAYLSGPGLSDLTITWTLSIDDPGNVANYAIYYSIGSYDANGVGYQFLTEVPSMTNFYVHSGFGLGGPLTVFYRVQSNGTGGEAAVQPLQVGKFSRPVFTGPQLISIPIDPANKSVASVLQTIKFDKAWTYDSSAKDWRSYMPSKPYHGGLLSIDRKVAVWVNVTEAGTMAVAGVVPFQTTIVLRGGWNFVGFPSFRANFTVGDLNATVGAEEVQGFAGVAPYYLSVLANSALLSAGEGYWVYVSQGRSWFIST